MSHTGRSSRVSTLLAAALLATGCSGGLITADDDEGEGEGGGGDSPGDGPDGEVEEALVCASGDADYQTIGAAIADAQAGGRIAVCAGTYRERLEIVGKPLSIRGVEGASATILDAGGKGVALLVKDTGSTGLKLEGFTIRGGDSRMGGGGVRCEDSGLGLVDVVVRDNRARSGGGLFASGCALEVAGASFVSNQGGEHGGGAFLSETAGEVAESTFQGNQATTGGGVHVAGGSVLLRGNEVRNNSAGLRGGGLFLDSDAPVEDNRVVDNSSGWTGGGVYIFEHAPVLRGNLVRDNRSDNDGGGFYLHRSHATISDGEVSGNQSGDDGGGIRLFESSARVEGNLIAGNRTADGGGGIRVSHVASLIANNVIRDNEATFGGGIDMDNDSSVVRGGVIESNRAWHGGGINATLFPWNGATFDGVRVARNSADDGGGIYIEDNFVPIAVRGLEVIDNQADRGGGLFVRGTDLTIENSVFAGNQGSDEGGGLYVGEPEPFDSPTGCPCPPASPSVAVDFTVFQQNQSASGSAVWVDTGGLSVASSIVAGHAGEAVVARGPEPVWQYNDTTPDSFAGMANPTGASGNISADPRFADEFRLAPDSPCVNAGDPELEDPDGSRADMGRYGGPEAP